MPKSVLDILIILILLLPACSPAMVSNPSPPEATPTEIPVSTLPPPTATPTPSPLPPTATPSSLNSPGFLSSPTPSPSPPTATPSPEPTVTPTSTPTPDWLNSFGRTADNLMYLGNPNAPVTLVDFSDFM